MSLQISEESMLIVMSVYGGLVLVLCYDVIRILRRIFYVGIVRIIIEDIIFWMVAAIFMFNIYLKYNYGRPRFFSIILTMGTMFAFEWFIGRKIIDILALKIRKVIRIIVKPLKKVLKLIKLKIGTKRKRKKGRKKWHLKTKKEQPNV
ncbi:MAG: hypothetical protein HFG28_04000 [Eubacterium sp.]|nr:hypothetical protein [Eubacterium sp.]